MAEEKLDEEDLAQFDDEANEIPTHLSVQPSLIKNGEMRSYQLEGLNWLIRLYHSGISAILADEMVKQKRVL